MVMNHIGDKISSDRKNKEEKHMKRMVSLVMAAAMAAGLLSGCGSSGAQGEMPEQSL